MVLNLGGIGRYPIRIEPGEITIKANGKPWHQYKEVGLEILRRQAGICEERFQRWRDAAAGTCCDLVFHASTGVQTGVKLVTSTVPWLGHKSKNILVPAHVMESRTQDIYDVVACVFMSLDVPGRPTQGCSGGLVGFVRPTKLLPNTRYECGTGIPDTGKGTTFVIPVKDAFASKVLLGDMLTSGVTL